MIEMSLCRLIEGNELDTKSEREDLMWVGIKTWGSGNSTHRCRRLRNSLLGRESYGMKKCERKGERKRGREGRVSRS